MSVRLLNNPPVRVIALVTIGLSLFFGWWFLGGKSVIQRYVEKMAEPWAEFQVPYNSVRLDGLQVTSGARILTICNKSQEDWRRILIQIDQGYVAALDKLGAGECKEVPIEKFAMTTWKRLPPPPALNVTKVEVLATVQRKGYASSSVHTPTSGAKQ